MNVPLSSPPRARFSAPTVPAPAEGAKPGRRQHSKTEAPSRVVIAVRLRLGVVLVERIGSHVDRLKAKELKQATTSASRRIAIFFTYKNDVNMFEMKDNVLKAKGGTQYLSIFPRRGRSMLVSKPRNEILPIWETKIRG